MQRYFKITDKDIEDNKFEFRGPEYEQNNNGPTKWNIPNEHIPVMDGSKKYIILKAAEDMVVPSIWKGFLGAANTGLNVFANKLNTLFGSAVAEDKADYNETFKPTVIHTGLSVVMGKDEVLEIHSLTNGETGVIISNGTQLVVDDVEIRIPVYNMFPSDVKILKGQPIAVGIFQKVELGDSINLDK